MAHLRSLASLALASAAALPSVASATPSTVYWAPATTYIQPYLVPHITYDTYFGKGGIISTSDGSIGPIYPITTGLTMGILPFEKVNLEIGFDLLLPSDDPLLLNAKLGIPEDIFFAGSPSLAVGIFGVGTADATEYNIIYGQIQKNLPWGGFISAGGYYGAGKEALWTGSDGNVNRAGFIGGLASPDIVVNLPGLKKIVFIGDVQTGKNAFGAGGVGITLYFNDAIDLITGPVFFFDSDIQPGKSSVLWTMQLDVDVQLLASPPAAPPAAQPAPPAGPASSMLNMPR